VSQHAPSVERYRREGDREWRLTELRGLNEEVELASVASTLGLRDVYHKVLTTG
jgi:hypothetical protein